LNSAAVALSELATAAANHVLIDTLQREKAPVCREQNYAACKRCGDARRRIVHATSLLQERTGQRN